MRAKAASADGENEVRARACSAVGGHGSCWVAPQAETAVRSASIGLAVRGNARSVVITASGTGVVARRWDGTQSPVQRRLATAGYVPCSTRSPIR
jgi:hypothetical protein